MNILITASVLLWQLGQVLVSIYFTHDKVVDFPKSGHIYSATTLGNKKVNEQSDS